LRKCLEPIRANTSGVERRPSIVRGRSAVKVLTHLEYDLHVVGDDLVLVRPVEEEHVAEGDARPFLE
jgi:hypothetical protein